MFRIKKIEYQTKDIRGKKRNQIDSDKNVLLCNDRNDQNADRDNKKSKKNSVHSAYKVYQKGKGNAITDKHIKIANEKSTEGKRNGKPLFMPKEETEKNGNCAKNSGQMI